MICPDCGVEFEDALKNCPLCGNRKRASVRRETAIDEIMLVKRTRKELRKNAWELSTIIAFSAIFVSAVVDQVTGGGLGWSLFTIAALSSVWGLSTILIFLYRKPYFMVPLLALVILFFLFMLDALIPGQKWFAGLALPITLSFFLFTILTIFISKKFRMLGFNLLGIIFIFISLFCISIEIFKDAFVNDLSGLLWSLITAVSILPLALIFLFLHYRMKKGKRLDSFFHV
jgi:hypothetical protein